jgi:Fibronectin type III domain
MGEVIRRVCGAGGSGRTPSGQLVELFGGPSAYSFGGAYNDLVTPTGQTFGAFPSAFPLVAGAGPWFGAATTDNNFAVGQMTLTDNEAHSTTLGTSLYIWNTSLYRLQNIPVPTTTGVFNPPGSNGATGSTLDQITPVTISGTHYIFAIGAVSYAGWQVALYGDAYWLMAFKETNGVWAFDSTHSKTAAQLHASSSAGASAFTATTNSFGETVYQSLGPTCMGLAPNSQDLLIGNYFYATGLFSGSIVALNPATGVVTAFYQFPNITDANSVPCEFSVRDLIINPTSGAGDERFLVTFDVFVRSSGANYGLHPLMEFSYNGTSTITQLSPPMSPFSLTDASYTNDYNIVGWDGSGNLWCPTNGGVGLGVFHGREMHFFEASGANIPTFEDGGASTVFPTFTKADFRFGGYGLPNGFSCSVNWDSADGLMVLLGKSGSAIAGAVPNSPALGTEMCVNGGLTSGTTGWNGFSVSTLTTTTDSDFASGHCLVMTSIAGANNVASQALVSVTAFENYILTAKIKGVTVPESVTAEMWWHDSTGALIIQSLSPVVTMTSTAVLYIECLAAAVPNSATAFLLFNFTAQSVGEQYKIGDVSWKSEPCLMTASVDTNQARTISGVTGPVYPNKGQIISSRLFFSTIDLSETYPADVGASVPQWITSMALSALTSTTGQTVPSASTLSSATGGNVSVTLVWTAPSSTGGSPITSYTVNRGTTSGGETTLVQNLSASALTYTDTSVTNGTEYFYTVQAVNAIGSSVASNELSVTPAAVTPNAPVLSVTAGNTQNTLNWVAPTTGLPITNYAVYSGPTSGSLALLTTLGAVLTYTHTGLTNGTEVFYAVYPFNASGQGTESNIVGATPTGTSKILPPQVTSLSAVVTGTSAAATWTNNGSLGTNNETDGCDFFVDGTQIGYAGYPSPAPTSYTFTGLSVGNHTLGVAPYNGAGVQTATTTPVTITTPPATTIPIGFYTGNLSTAESLSNSLGLNPLQGYSTYCDGSTWSSIASFSPPTLPTGCVLMLGVNMCPDGTNISAVASNLSNFTTLAHRLPNGTICRIGWEFDIDTGPWGPGNGNTPAAYATAFQQIVTTMRAVNSSFKFDFCCNAGTSSLAQLKTYYPGNAYVDYIGGDHYANPAPGGSNEPYLTASITLASQQGKPFSCGEWGLHGNPGPVTGYDYPTFINNMYQIFTNPTAAASKWGWPAYTVGYHSYFNAYPSGGYDSILTDAPNSFAAFKANFG